MGTRSRTVTISGRFGPRRVSLGRASIAPGTARTFSASARIPRPRLWRPSRPALYDATLTASVAGRRVQTFSRKVGVRSVKVDGDGRLTLNGRRVNLRGVGLHNDSIENGFAVDNATRDRQLGWARELGSGIIRLHYPPHPQTLEQADRLGMLVWAEVPVWQVEAEELAKPSVRTAAVNAVEEMVRVNRNHPSVAIWSVGNELGARVGPAQAGYIREATEAAKALDPDRPVGIAVAAGPTVGCQAGYAPLDLVGINDYFGWYPGGNAVIADRELLSAYLDTVRACYRRKAVMITEFGAEANRDGPVEERGTWAFQRDFMNYHLGVFATKPWLSGAIWWALQEFRVRPDWDGGNPRPQSPTHQKGVVAFDGTRKPTFADLQRLFRSVNQFGG
jgi:beta-glucuronidase